MPYDISIELKPFYSCQHVNWRNYWTNCSIVSTTIGKTIVNTVRNEVKTTVHILSKGTLTVQARNPSHTHIHKKKQKKNKTWFCKINKCYLEVSAFTNEPFIYSLEVSVILLLLAETEIWGQTFRCLSIFAHAVGLQPYPNCKCRESSNE